MLRRLIGHVHGNVVAYLALMVSVIGGGGGYALAATTHHQTKHHKKTTIVACASRRSGELFLHHRGKCAKGRHMVRWSIRGPRGKKGARGATGAAGAPAPSIFAAVDTGQLIAGLQSPAEKGMTVARDGVGVYTVTITDPTCSQTVYNVPTVTPSSAIGGAGNPPTGATPVAYVDSSAGRSTQFGVDVGYVNSSGAFVPVDYDFDVQDTCLASGSQTNGAIRAR